MNFFKKVGNSISKPFKKGGAIQSAFSKGSNLARGISTGLQQTSKILGKVGSVGQQVLNNPVVSGALLAAAPELYLPAQGLLAGAQQASKVAQLGSNLSNVDSYKKAGNLKGQLENVQDAKKRFDMLNQETQKLNFV